MLSKYTKENFRIVYEQKVVGHFQKFHNTLCLSLQNLSQLLLLFYLGTMVSPRRKWKQCLCKILGGQTKSIMVFLKVASSVHSYSRIALIERAVMLAKSAFFPSQKICKNFNQSGRTLQHITLGGIRHPWPALSAFLDRIAFARPSYSSRATVT